MKTVTATCESTFSTVKTSGSAIREYILDEKEPNWSPLPIVLATIVTYKYNLPESISDIRSFGNMEELVFKYSAQIDPNPFARGSLRFAYCGTIIPTDLCIKFFITISFYPFLGHVLFCKQLSCLNGSPVSSKNPSSKGNHLRIGKTNLGELFQLLFTLRTRCFQGNHSLFLSSANKYI